jgi:glutamine amidotransferase
MEEELKTQVLINKKPFLGICVGMQLLANFGLEHGKHSGLGFIEGSVEKITSKDDSNLKIPHIGWNNINIKNPHPILNNIKNDEHFYFVHSFHFIPKNQNDVVATVNYGSDIAAIISRNNIVATQFHPEKSSDAGLLLLKNFIG